MSVGCVFCTKEHNGTYVLVSRLERKRGESVTCNVI